jgi:hypothetical protein
MSNAIESDSAQLRSHELLALRALVIVLGAACLAEFWYANAHTEEFRLQSPLLTPRLWNLYLTFKLASVVALFGIWNWRRWGLKLIVAMALAQLFMEIYTAEAYSLGFILTTLRIPLAVAPVWFLGQRTIHRFQ